MALLRISNPFKRANVVSSEVTEEAVAAVDDGNVVQINDIVRVEPGPKLKRDIATKELLANAITAKHYQFGQPDAMGNIIVEGEPMTYLAWGGDETGREVTYYVYLLVNGSWAQMATYDDRAAAIIYAQSLKGFN